MTVCSRSPNVASPKVPDSTAITVMPTWTVANSREGADLSSSAVRAPLLPVSASPRRRALRADTKAISAIAKKPLSRTRTKTTVSCRASIVRVPSRAAARAAASGGGVERKACENAARAASPRGFAQRGGAGSGRPARSASAPAPPPAVRRSTRIKFDDEVRLHRHRIGHIGRFGGADKAALHAVMVDFDIVGNVALARACRLHDQGHRLGPRAEFDLVAVAHRIGRDRHPPAVDPHMA